MSGIARTGSTKPYFIRAIYEWCSDNGLTPYLGVKVDDQTRVPLAYVKDGEIVLNIGANAVHQLQLGNDAISFSARFGGVPHGVYVPLSAVIGIFSRETGQGMEFEGGEPDLTPPEPSGGHEAPGGDRPRLRVVK